MSKERTAFLETREEEIREMSKLQKQIVDAESLKPHPVATSRALLFVHI